MNYQYLPLEDSCSFRNITTVKRTLFQLQGTFLYCPRFITVTYFLTDVDDGGEIVFPFANNKFEVFRLDFSYYILISCMHH